MKIKLILIAIVLFTACKNSINRQLSNPFKVDGIEFSLFEAKSNKPMPNQQVEVNYFQMVYDGEPILDPIQKVQTDGEGKFSLPKSIFNDKQIGIRCGDKYQTIVFRIDNGKFCLGRIKNRFGETKSLTCYDLAAKTETNYVFYKDTTVSKMTNIKLVAYDISSFSFEFQQKIIENKLEFESNQRKLWEFMWTEFEDSYKGETTPPLNIHYWFTQINTCSRVLKLDLKGIFKEAKKIKDINKKYYFLYSLCHVADDEKRKGNKISKEILDWIDIEVKNFYAKRTDLSLRSTKFNSNLPGDYLPGAYHFLKN